jgi:hypothetical protein
MARIKVVGVSISSGEYQGFPYKNLVLHTLRKEEHTEGERAEQIKIKYKNLREAFNLDKTAAEIDRLTPRDFSDLLGKEIACYYDQYRTVTQVIVFAPEDKK